MISSKPEVATTNQPETSAEKHQKDGIISNYYNYNSSKNTNNKSSSIFA